MDLKWIQIYMYRLCYLLTIDLCGLFIQGGDTEKHFCLRCARKQVTKTNKPTENSMFV